MSRTYFFKNVQQIPITREEAWNFFSRPQNLPYITPEKMGFIIKSKYQQEHMYAGQLIEYTVSPVLGIPLYWMTEITHVEPLSYFVDEQRYGPYSLWHHQHHFKEIDGGVEMTDIVHYRIPMGWIGDLANTLLVQKQLKDIFMYRVQAIEKRFGKIS